MKYEKSCGAVVYRKEEEKLLFLVIKHRNSGHWDFPKGKMEENESEKETATREVLEETGLSVRLVDGFRENINYYPRKNTYKTVVFFLAESPAGDVKLQREEMADSAWLTYGEAKERLTYETARGILDKARGFLNLYRLA